MTCLTLDWTVKACARNLSWWLRQIMLPKSLLFSCSVSWEPTLRIINLKNAIICLGLIGKVEDVNKVQTLLFSATLPEWVKKVGCCSSYDAYIIHKFLILTPAVWSKFEFSFIIVQISTRFLKPTKRTADLVGNEKMKASANVRHLVLPCTRAARNQLIPDVIRCYSRFV